jgi:hypothetical protein
MNLSCSFANFGAIFPLKVTDLTVLTVLIADEGKDLPGQAPAQQFPARLRPNGS